MGSSETKLYAGKELVGDVEYQNNRGEWCALDELTTDNMRTKVVRQWKVEDSQENYSNVEQKMELTKRIKVNRYMRIFSSKENNFNATVKFGVPKFLNANAEFVYANSQREENEFSLTIDDELTFKHELPVSPWTRKIATWHFTEVELLADYRQELQVKYMRPNAAFDAYMFDDEVSPYSPMGQYLQEEIERHYQYDYDWVTGTCHFGLVPVYRLVSREEPLR